MPFLRGEVTDNKDPKMRGRVRVFVWGVHKKKDDDLPWAEVMGDTADALHQGQGKAPKPIPKGATVWVEFEAGDINCPVVVGIFVGHKAETMLEISPANSDWAMAVAAGAATGGIGGVVGAVLGGLGGIGGSGGSGGVGGTTGATGTGAAGGATGAIGTCKPWTVSNGLFHMDGQKDKRVDSEGYDKYAPMIIAKAQAAGIEPTALLAFCAIESSFNPTAVNGSYVGLFQMDSRQISNLTNPEANTDACIKMFLTNKHAWEKQFPNIPFTAGPAYLMHQQGIGGGPALYKASSDPSISALSIERKFHSEPTASQTLTGNGKPVTISAHDFAYYWIDYAEGLAAYFKSKLAGTPASSGTSGGCAPVAGTSTTDPNAAANSAAAASGGTPHPLAAKAAEYALAHAVPRDNGLCATYVNNAWRNGVGISVNGDGVATASNLISRHPDRFISVPYSASYVPIIGDTMSIPADDAYNSARQHNHKPKPYKGPIMPGHVAIYTSKGWCSDFIQGTKYGNNGAANSAWNTGIRNGVDKVVIARLIK